MKQLLIAVAMIAGVAIGANEINLSAGLRVQNGFLDDQRRVSSFSADQATAGSVAGVQLIGTNEAAVTYGSIVTPGWAYFRNIEAVSTNVVTITLGVMDLSTNFVAIAEMQNGEPAMFRIATNTIIYAKSDTEGSRLDKLILED